MTATPAITLTDLRGRLLTAPAARREYDIALISLSNAEDLAALLAANPLPGNSYYDDAMASAIELVAEMERNLTHVMDNCTPESIGL